MNGMYYLYKYFPDVSQRFVKLTSGGDKKLKKVKSHGALEKERERERGRGGERGGERERERGENKIFF
jgi:hypothetical protein